MDNTANAVYLSRVSKVFGTSTVLNDINLSLTNGRRVALLGPNGAGKSTLLKTIVGLTRPNSGTVVTLGTNITEPSSKHAIKELRQKIGFVFQNHSLVPRTSALSNVVHGFMGAPGSWRAVSHSLAPEAWRVAAWQMLVELGLSNHILSKVNQLSGGQAQRVAIARAMVRSPQLLIADEPAASLDPIAGEEIMSLFSQLVQKRGTTLLFTTHNINHARTYADEIVALKNHKIHWFGSATDFDDAISRTLYI